MKIVAGTVKGKRIQTLDGRETTRPTTEKVREAVFGSLQFEIAGSKVLDLFAGSGAMGIEALSRGAASAVFVDNNPGAVRVIRKNIEGTPFEKDTKVLLMDYMAALESFGRAFDYIFIDPPYKSGYYDGCLSVIYDRGLISPEGKIVVEHDRDVSLKEKWPVIREKRYGNIYISYLSGDKR